MLTYRVDRKHLKFIRVEYSHRTTSSIWIDGRRRDTDTDRYAYLDSIAEVELCLEEVISNMEIAEQDSIRLTYANLRRQLKNAVTQESTNIKRL